MIQKILVTTALTLINAYLIIGLITIGYAVYYGTAFLHALAAFGLAS